jgi:hypothetical protein
MIRRDGRASAFFILYAGGSVCFALSTYFALDLAFGISGLFLLEMGSAAERELRDVAVMVLGVLWPYL